MAMTTTMMMYSTMVWPERRVSVFMVRWFCGSVVKRFGGGGIGRYGYSDEARETERSPFSRSAPPRAASAKASPISTANARTYSTMVCPERERREDLPGNVFTSPSVAHPPPRGQDPFSNARICLARGGVLECRLPFSTHSETGADPATGRAAYPAA